METIKKVMEELKALADKDDAVSSARKNDLTEWLVAHKDGNEQEIDTFMESWLCEMEADNEDIKKEALRKQMDEKLYKLTPWSYIAKEYFGKSVSWLTQRVNGYPVRGRVYTLNEKQKQTLNRALSEIGEFIGSYRFA